MKDLKTLQQQTTAHLMGRPIVADIRQGRLRRSQYLAYMKDVYSYALHSSGVIATAAVRLIHTHPPLAEYLLHHAGEELGHDVWAAGDLRDLGLTDSEIQAVRPSSPCARMVALEYFYAAHDNPVGLFGWMFVLESLGGVAGGTVAAGIDKVLGLNGKGTYFLRGHGDADAHHSVDLFEVISKNVTTPADRAVFEFMVNESQALYAAILDNAFAHDGSVAA